MFQYTIIIIDTDAQGIQDRTRSQTQYIMPNICKLSMLITQTTLVCTIMNLRPTTLIYIFCSVIVQFTKYLQYIQARYKNDTISAYFDCIDSADGQHVSLYHFSDRQCTIFVHIVKQ